MWNAFYFFLRNLFCLVCYLIILKAKALIFRCFTYLWSCHLLILSFPLFHLFRHYFLTWFVFLSVAWKARHRFFFWMVTYFASFTRTWFITFTIFWTFLFRFGTITVVLVALTLTEIFGLIYFLNFLHRSESQIMLIIVIKCVETYTVIFGPI